MTGDATSDGQGHGEARGGELLVVRVELVHSRWRHFGWTLFGVIVGGLLVTREGWGPRLLGAGVLAFTVGALRDFVQTYRHAPGVFGIAADRLRLPTGLCTGKTLELGWAEVRHAYLLRRSLTLAGTNALLVVETTRGVFEYPREWFWGDGDQRQIVRALAARA